MMDPYCVRFLENFFFVNPIGDSVEDRFRAVLGDLDGLRGVEKGDGGVVDVVILDEEKRGAVGCEGGVLD